MSDVPTSGGYSLGDRIGAFVSAKDGVVRFLGYGVYEGDHVPPKGTHRLPGLEGFANPRLKLDNGDVVWGCECWWGPEAKMKAMLDEADEIITVRMAQEKKDLGVT